MLRGSRFSRGGGDLKTPFLAGKERELLESKKWPPCFSQSVDITRVQIDAFKPWITRRVTELMGVEDEIVVDYCISQLKFFGENDAKANAENAGDGGICLNEKPLLDPKKLQINLTGFMAKNARVFVKELWELLLAAQDNEYGIPQAFIDEKKRELAAIQEAAKEAEDNLQQMASELAAVVPIESVDNATLKDEPSEDHSPPVRGPPSDDRERHRSGSRDARQHRSPRGDRSSVDPWYKQRKYTRHRNQRPGAASYRREDPPRDTRRGSDYRRRRSPSETPSRSRSVPYRHRRKTYRKRTESHTSLDSDSHRSRSSSRSSEVRRNHRRRRRRTYSSASSASAPTASSDSASRSPRSISSSSSHGGRRRQLRRSEAGGSRHHRDSERRSRRRTRRRSHSSASYSSSRSPSRSRSASSPPRRSRRRSRSYARRWRS
ncbi:splicing factor [Babesia caballi]|uniref:Splicing factor n=1 Tax=Babesia caballi TaxID=5871 RepID=A0AAV4LLU0_BABCB|nr:splicing factor [Babesia caballi]